MNMSAINASSFLAPDRGAETTFDGHTFALVSIWSLVGLALSLAFSPGADMAPVLAMLG
jgi:hypothetical protein